MGNQQSQSLEQRLQRAQKTGVVTLSHAGLKKWPSSVLIVSSYIKSLDLSNNNMRELPVTLTGNYYSVLRTLNLADNKLNILNRNICTVVTLETLILRKNRLTALPSSDLCNMSELRHLDLSYNNFILVIPELSTIRSLVKLDLSFNQLIGPLSPVLGNLIRLEELSVQSNKLTTIPQELCHCVKLKTLNITNNKDIKVIPEKVFVETILVNLGVEGTGIDSTILLHLPGYDKVRLFND